MRLFLSSLNYFLFFCKGHFTKLRSHSCNVISIHNFLILINRWNRWVCLVCLVDDAKLEMDDYWKLFYKTNFSIILTSTFYVAASLRLFQAWTNFHFPFFTFFSGEATCQFSAWQKRIKNATLAVGHCTSMQIRQIKRHKEKNFSCLMPVFPEK